MIKLAGTSKKTVLGFVPMITIRGERGHMMGSRAPQIDFRDARTFGTALEAEIEANVIALRAAIDFDCVRV